MLAAKERAEAARALLAIRKRIRWKPGKGVQHLEKRKRLGHLPLHYSLDDYNEMIGEIVRDERNSMYLYKFAGEHYYAVRGTFKSREWLVIFGRGGVGVERRELIEKFAVGVQYLEVSGFELLELLDIRSAIARQEHSLSEEERKRLEEADRCFLRNVRQIYAVISQIADLAEMRRMSGAAPSHWWWYLEELVEAEKVAV